MEGGGVEDVEGAGVEGAGVEGGGVEDVEGAGVEGTVAEDVEGGGVEDVERAGAGGICTEGRSGLSSATTALCRTFSIRMGKA